MTNYFILLFWIASISFLRSQDDNSNNGNASDSETNTTSANQNAGATTSSSNSRLNRGQTSSVFNGNNSGFSQNNSFSATIAINEALSNKPSFSLAARGFFVPENKAIEIDAILKGIPEIDIFFEASVSFADNFISSDQFIDEVNNNSIFREGIIKTPQISETLISDVLLFNLFTNDPELFVVAENLRLSDQSIDFNTSLQLFVNEGLPSIQDTSSPSIIRNPLITEGAIQLSDLLLRELIITGDHSQKTGNTVAGGSAVNQNANLNEYESYFWDRTRLYTSGFTLDVLDTVASYSSSSSIANNINAVITAADIQNRDGSSFINLGEFINDNNNTNLLGAHNFDSRIELDDVKLHDFFGALAGKITVKDTIIDLSDYMNSTYGVSPFADSPEHVFIASFGDLFLEGNITIGSGSVYDSNSHNVDSVTFGAANDLQIKENTKIKVVNVSLVMGSKKTLNMKNISLESNKDILLGSLDSLIFNNSSITIGGNNAGTFIAYATNKITADNLSFLNIRDIYMASNTVSLSNIDFPVGSNVHLVSKDGPIDGKYPNFNSEVVNRVNFIQNVTYGSSSAMSDKATFDANSQGKIRLTKF